MGGAADEWEEPALVFGQEAAGLCPAGLCPTGLWVLCGRGGDVGLSLQTPSVNQEVPPHASASYQPQVVVVASPSLFSPFPVFPSLSLTPLDSPRLPSSPSPFSVPPPPLLLPPFSSSSLFSLSFLLPLLPFMPFLSECCSVGAP